MKGVKTFICHIPVNSSFIIILPLSLQGTQTFQKTSQINRRKKQHVNTVRKFYWLLYFLHTIV